MPEETPTPGESTRPKRRRRLRLWLVPVAFAVGYAAFVGRLFLFRPGLEPVPATTAVEERYVRPDGTVDYVAALNDEWSEGVTPENNAAVPLARAFGPAVVAPEAREAYFGRLGIEPPEAGAEFLALDEFLRREGIDPKRQEELFKAEGFGIAEDYPELTSWVERNATPLEQITEASRRERFYAPVLPGAPTASLLDASLEMLHRCRDVARLLRVRGLLRLETGDVAGACDDAVTCHRLGRLVSGHPTILGALVGMAIDAQAAQISEAIVLSGRLDRETARRFRAEIERLPPLADVARTVDRGERLVTLDAALNVAKGSAGAAPTGMPLPVSQGLDQNVLLREFNGLYDGFVAAIREPGYRKRADRLDELRRAAGSASRPGTAEVALAVLFGSRTALTKQVAAVLAGLFLPALDQVQVAEDRAVMRARLVRIGAALAEYRAAEGEFPETLDRLRPVYLNEIPEDFYAAAPPKYRRTGDGFLLYAVGPNGRDDGGASLGERQGGPETCDDIRFGITPASTRSVR